MAWVEVTHPKPYQISKSAMVRGLSDVFFFYLFFLFSIYLYQFYLKGDQFYYNSFYESLVGASFGDISDLQNFNTGSTEPLFGIIMWAFAQLFEKVFILSVINGLFGVVLVRCLKRLNVSPLIFPLIFFNYYLTVILLPAERLKFSLLAVMLAFLAPPRMVLFLLLGALAFHLQTMIILSIIGAQITLKATKALLLRKNRFWRNLLFVGALIGVGMVVRISFQEQISDKFLKYQTQDITEILHTLIFMMTALVLSRRRQETFVMFLPILYYAYLLGGERVNMIGFLLLSGYLLNKNRGLNINALVFLLYFDIKNAIFLESIMKYGTGWP